MLQYQIFAELNKNIIEENIDSHLMPSSGVHHTNALMPDYQHQILKSNTTRKRGENTIQNTIIV